MSKGYEVIKKNLYKKVDKSIFDINWDMYVVKNDLKYESAIIDLREESFCINTISYNQEREYKNIIDYKLKSNLLIIEGYFPEYQKLEIYAFSKDLSYFIDIIESKINKIEDIKLDEENDNFEKLLNKIDINTNSSRYIAYNSELKPFCIDFYENKLIFKHNNNIYLSDFIIKDIVDVIIVDNGVYFDKISIICKDSTDI